MLSRRHLLQSTLPCALGLIPGASAFAQTSPNSSLSFDLTQDTRAIKLLRNETKESLNITYMHEGQWENNAYAQICWILRDVRANEWVKIDVKLIAILDWTQRYLGKYGYNQPLVILSGFRSKKTNNSIENAARNSMHLYGKAIDFAVPGLDTRYLAELMNYLVQGGVGAYAHKGFVHIDTGRLRRW